MFTEHGSSCYRQQRRAILCQSTLFILHILSLLHVDLLLMVDSWVRVRRAAGMGTAFVV
jgi:hypothetical protein